MITPSFGLTATERVLPKLALDFTTASLDSRVTFTRSGNTATVTGSNGYISPVNADVPRFDYNPVTLVCKGLLIEETRSNLLLQSADFFSASWTKSNLSVSADVVTSPDGTQNADKLVENTVNTTHGISQAPTLTAGIHSVSFFAKAGERSWMRVICVDGGAYINLSSGVFGTVSAGTVSFAAKQIKNYGNGWYRIEVSFTAATGANTVLIRLATSDGGQTYLGDGTSGTYIWGAQLEAGAFATSYIPTTTTALTRNADVATMTGTNFSDFWQASKGGAQVLALPSTVSGIRPLVQYDDGTANNIIALRGNAANPELQIVDGGTPQVQLDAGTIVANTPYSLTGWWQTNDCKARQNSGATVSDYTATIPTVTQARLGSDGTNYLNGHLATVNYYTSFFGQSIYTRRKNKVFASLF